MARKSLSQKKPRGVIAAGHLESAKAGKVVLESGGNAVDAAIATALAACVAEPVLTSLAAGGFMLIHDAESSKQTLLDFFVAMPGEKLNPKQQLAGLVPTPVDFGETVQMFHGGHASVGVPGFVAGLFAAHERFGQLPMTELVAPAKALARQGVKQNEQQEFLLKILSGILELSPDSRKLFFTNGQPLKRGSVFKHPDIVATLDELARRGAASFYRGELAKQIVSEVSQGGGYLTADDLAHYQVAVREPVRCHYRDSLILTNPPPSSGGPLIAHTMHLLAGFDLPRMAYHRYNHLRHLVEALITTNEVRQDRYDENIHDEDVLERLLSTEALSADHRNLGNRLGPPGPSRTETGLPPSRQGRTGNTTHLSVIDSDGNAVSMTSSNGANSGIAVPGTGILLNNILGEEDLNPQGFHQHPVGRRIPSMMSPSLVMTGGQPRLAVGSAGSNRIRSAIVQVISAVIDFGLEIKPAVEEPRLHVEAGTVELEGGIDSRVAKELSAAGYQINLWKGRNLFFGGAQAVSRDPDTGKLAGAGDSRRGGVAVSVG